jgi:glycosyltransferase involved in cell wall biosynthesis
MNILHFSAGSLGGGAARGAYCLHKGLVDLGVESFFVSSGRNNPSDDRLISLNNGVGQNLKFVALPRLGSLPKYFYVKRKPFLFSTGLEGIDITNLEAYRDADIIHLHWINGLLSLKTLKKIKKPVVWTIRDMWPFTGGCHYSMGCDGYTASCGECPQLGSKSKKDLSSFVYRTKKRSLPKTIRPIGISEWITNRANESDIFSGYPVKTIYNNIDLKSFYPEDKVLARKKLGLSESNKIVLIGANSVTDFYKGFDLFLKSLTYFSPDEFQIVTFGTAEIELCKNIKMEVSNLGFITSDEKLRWLYSAADVFVAPSRMDAFGKTVAESMACATPVVCFDACGPSEIVAHKTTGYKAEPFKCEDMANGINWVLNLKGESLKCIQDSSVDRVRTMFNVDVIAKQYHSVYQDMLKFDKK